MSKWGFLLLAMAAGAAGAEDRACMVESTYFVAGEAVGMRDCMQAPASTPTALVHSQCNELAAIALRMGGESRGLTFLPSCPLPAQGICKNYMRSGNDAYYYERGASDIMLLPKACASRGGTWQSAP